jgi:hydrogenase large subunit
MTQHIKIDPITRIEGHLRVDVEVDNGRVSDAWVSSTMWRGMEKILQERDAREAWLFAQRICGVCTTVHAIASVRAVEDALKLQIPANAEYIRNLILIHHALHDHIVHFYQLSALDWVDVLQISRADLNKASALAEKFSSWTRNSREEMKAAKDKAARIVDSGNLGILTNGYWGHKAMHLRPEENLLIFSHYLQALEFQRKASQVVAVLGGKTPHIQNLTVGGVANAINLDSEAALGMAGLESIKVLMGEVSNFVQSVYFPDSCALAGYYSEWFGSGKGSDRYLAVPDLPRDAQASRFDLPGGFLRYSADNSVGQCVKFMDGRFRELVTEDVTHAYYRGDKALHPWKGETVPEFTDWHSDQKYTWVKAAWYEGQPAEVGPLAQVLIGYMQGHALTRKWTDVALDQVSSIAGHRIGLEQLRSTMGRHLARAIRAAVLADLAQEHWQLLADNISKGDNSVHNPPSFPDGEIEGVGTHEAPRGALSHWVVIKSGKIKNYQAVVPSTWNASPRDKNGARGPYEAALLGTEIADAEKPLEALRTIHSFDPCMACACHAFDPSGRKIGTARDL